MPRKKQTQDQTEAPQAAADAFLKLWQEKWQQMLAEKGWPTGAAMPDMAQMPFMNPFLSFGFPNMGHMMKPGDTTAALQQKIAELEKRMAALEEALSKD